MRSTHRKWQPLAFQGSSVVVTTADGGPLLECELEWRDARRIINSEYAGENLFDRLAPASDAEDLRAFADLTNPVLLDAIGRASLVAPEDRPVGPGSGLVMASFAYPARATRFSTGQWGVFYAADEELTAIEETSYHRARLLKNSGPTTLDMVVLRVHLAGTSVDVRDGLPAPAGIYDPSSYGAAQMFGRALHRAKAEALAYDSVRRPGRHCVAVFRPAMVHECMPIHSRRYTWDGTTITVR